MSINILFVFEGEKTEKQITNNLTNFFINDNIVVQCAYCAEIYQLYNEISSDEDLDTFVLLKSVPQNYKILSAYNRNDFAEIYLFFDYDGHASKAEDEKIVQLLNFFNEETSSGKLFISYPMVEALKHYSDTVDFKDLKVIAKENIGYKHLVSQECNHVLNHFSKYDKSIWILLIDVHLKKMNHIVNNIFEIPESTITQIDIFSNQLEKYINVDSTVAVLSSFPIFIFDYYGFHFISKFLISLEQVEN